jgi:hypothetical protein
MERARGELFLIVVAFEREHVAVHVRPLHHATRKVVHDAAAAVRAHGRLAIVGGDGNEKAQQVPVAKGDFGDWCGAASLGTRGALSVLMVPESQEELGGDVGRAVCRPSAAAA